MHDFILTYGLFLTLSLYGIGALYGAVFGFFKTDSYAWITAHICAALAASSGLVFGLTALFSGKLIQFHTPMYLGVMQNILSFRIDGLAAFFIVLISTAAIATSIYGSFYFDQYLGKYRLGGLGVFYNVLLASITLLVSVNNAVIFLFLWEIMAISSYFLVIFERHKPENIRAGSLYILISQLGVACLFGTFLLLYRYTGSWDFDIYRQFSGAIPYVIQNIVLALALVGLGSKAGIIPLHVWLPEAYPAAPSHISALMSAVMSNTGIFMIIRFFIDFFPVSKASWGFFILAIGAITSVIGILYALAETDIKRLLAYSSVENMGIVFMGIGSSIAFFSYGLPNVAVVALTASLYQTINHSFFKSILFLSAGSVIHATGTRNMEEYGGLIKKMPFTAFFFLLGAVAISGLPPLNGFVSEWLTFQALIGGIVLLPTIAKTFFLLGTASLVLTGGLALACFVKAFGTTFLARARGTAAEHAREASYSMNISIGILSVLVILFGLCGSTIAPLIGHVVLGLRRAGTLGAITLANPLQTLQLGSFASVSMMGVFAAIFVSIVFCIGAVSAIAGRRKIIISRTWDCGAPLTPRMEITAAGFSRSLVVIFKGLLRPSIQRDIEYHDSMARYFVKSKAVHVSLPNLYYTYLYLPLVRLLEISGRRARKIQTGNLHMYILYIVVTLITLLTFALK